jgi:hypothetical protein
LVAPHLVFGAQNETGHRLGLLAASRMECSTPYELPIILSN